MRNLELLTAMLLAASLVAVPPVADETAQAAAAAAEPAEEQKILYALGAALSRNISSFDFTEAELATVQRGFVDGALNRELEVSLEEYGPKIDPMLQARMAGVTEKEKQAGAAFRVEKSKVPGAETTATGVIYREIAAGNGPSPKPDDDVKIHYTGTLRDGSKFDSSYDGPAGEPVQFNLQGVIACFSEGVQRMKVGGKAELVCPPEAAYGDRGRAPLIRPGATLVFEVELVSIVAKPTPMGGPKPVEPNTADDAPTP